GDVFYSDVQRTVVVYNDDITGVYEASVSRDGSVMPIVADILIVKVGDIRYTISDWIGGWYDQYYEYGSRYAFAGTMEIDANNNLIHKSHSDPWGYDGSFSDSPAAV
ncbi:BT_2262 family domain-containing protein, partial [Plebeiibacterium sediminum]